MRKLPITILIIGLLAVLITWLWPSAAPSNSLASANGGSVEGELSSSADKVRPGSINIASERSSTQAQIDTWMANEGIAGSRLNEQSSAHLKQRFDEANLKLSQGKLDESAEVYSQLIEEYPNFVEPYVNLASVQAQSGRLEEARLTLAKAAEANQSTKVLFTSINKLHGALAAQAYRNALETKGFDVISASLPKVRNLATDFEQAQQIARLAESLEQEKSRQANLTANSKADSQALDQLRTQLQESSEQIASLNSNHANAIKALQAKLDLESERGVVKQAELTRLQNLSSNAESDLVAKLRIELREVESALSESKSQAQDLIAANQDLAQQLEKARVAAVVAVNEPQVTVKPDVEKPSVITPTVVKPTVVTPSPKPVGLSTENRAMAIDLVKGWAQAWSSQNVESYLSFYVDDYSSSSNLSREQWVSQRRVRLTNKSFINVAVRDFGVSTTSDGFDVTFTQHYRSNTLDDTIRKRISFALAAGKSWRMAKINGEEVIKR